MPVLPDWVVQVLQVVVVLALAPLITGVIARGEAIIQQRRGPRLLQPYHDIAKLLCKETVLPAPAGPLFRAAPYVSFAGYATVPLLIPVLTNFGLPLGYMGDILAGGLILGMAGFVISAGRDRQWLALCAAGIKPVTELRCAERADGDLRGVRRRPDDAHRSSVCPGSHAPVLDRRGRAAEPSADRRCVLHAGPQRDRPDPDRQSRRNA